MRFPINIMLISAKSKKVKAFIRKYRIIERAFTIGTLAVAFNRDFKNQIREERMVITEKYHRNKIDKLEQQQDSLTIILDATNKAMSIYINHSSMSATDMNDIPLPAWKKILAPDKVYIIAWVNPAYEMFLPNGMSYLDLFGKTGHYLNEDFGNIYQENDKLASETSGYIVVEEPVIYREQIIRAKFVKWRDLRDYNIVYGMFVEFIK